METLNILYQDADLVAVHKPAGLLVHRSEIDRHETRFAVQIVRDQLGQSVFPLHRLDKPTEGILVFALSANIARQMMTVFMEREVRKTYHAVVRGYTAEADTIDYPLSEELDKMTDAKAQQDKPAQTAITEYRRLATVELPMAVGRYASARYSFLALQPQTGRKHQIRRHLKHIFHPIVGDTSHGDGKHNTLFREYFNCRQLLLAATGLEFPHPVTQQPLVISAPFGDEFANVINVLGWQHCLDARLISNSCDPKIS